MPKEKIDQNQHKTKAAQIWVSMNHSEQTGVRFGMFPVMMVVAAENEGFNGHEICRSLMAVAKEQEKS
ncbi:MAG: hypothetical protein WC359_12940 [Dehalococcoidia bacterium]|jgi:hypothetical protein